MLAMSMLHAKLFPVSSAETAVRQKRPLWSVIVIVVVTVIVACTVGAIISSTVILFAIVASIVVTFAFIETQGVGRSEPGCDHPGCSEPGSKACKTNGF